ncbi:hypothetical protein AAG906_009540 [Vitis piasezkii]
MASSRNYPNGLSIAAIMLLIILSLPLLPSRSVGSESSEDGENLKQMKMVLGSRPPKCVNRCLSCTPCTAALVIPPPHKNGLEAFAQQDESYYLLSWKCKCGNKLFQP